MVNRGEWGTGGYMALFISLLGSAWPLSFTMFFFNLANGSRLSICIMFLFCSTFGVVYGLAHVGRSGVTYWVMCLFFNYLFFRPVIRYRIQEYRAVFRKWRISKRLTIFASLIFFVIFVLITVGRNLDDHSVNDSHSGIFFHFVTYFGQTYGNFNDYYKKNWLASEIYYGKYNGSLFCGILEQFNIIKPYNHNEVLSEVLFHHYRSRLQPGTFNTLLKEISIDFGLWNSFIIYIAYFLICIRMILKRKGKWDLSQILLYSFAFSVPYNGYFFFSYGSSLSNATAIYYIFGYFLARRYLKVQFVEGKQKNFAFN
ncbi:O-antigen polymerase [Desulfonema magnum]|nr:O-antigen polymerase [Desulfonema magnum]